MTTFDRIDGGIPTVFLDGPKAGQTGVVTPSVHGQPPEQLVFMDGSVVYLRHGKDKLIGKDPISGQRRRLTGVTYRLDPQCGLALKVRAIEAAEAAARLKAGAGA